jgi:hypothetical protein
MYKDAEDFFNNMKIRKYGSENSDLFLLPYFLKNKNYKVIIYGGGAVTKVAVRYMRDILDIRPVCIVDVNPKCKYIEDIEVISLSEFHHKCENEFGQYVAVMATSYYTFNTSEKVEIVKRLTECGVNKEIDIYLNIYSIIKIDWFAYILEHKKEFIQGYYRFGDAISKQTYVEFLSAIMEGHVYEGVEFEEKDKYFGDGSGNDIYRHYDNECWINIGASRGDSIYHFINNGYKFEKIYAVEGNKAVTWELQRNLSFLDSDLYSKIEVVARFCGMNGNDGQFKLDDHFREKRVTLINMDIEGAEYDTLCSAEQIIKNQRPVLAICVYHKQEDLVKLPQLIENMVSDYCFYLRKYPSLVGRYYDGIFRLNELVLYAVPKERIMKTENRYESGTF